MTEPAPQAQAVPEATAAPAKRRQQQPKKPNAPRLTLRVTAEIIEESKQRDSSHCMVAEATKAAFREVKGYDCRAVSVDIQTIRLTDPKRGLRDTWMTPRAIQEAILKFDQGITPEPFEVVLRAAQVTKAAIAKPKAGKKPGTKAQQEAAALARSRKTLKIAPAGGEDALSEKQRKAREELRNASLVERAASGHVLERQGGKPPPLTPVGRRRAFGLRGIEF